MNSFILGICDKSYFVEIFLIIKTIFKIACYIAPLIVIIISMIHIFKAVTNGKDEDLKEALKVTVKRIIAGLLIAFLPALINDDNVDEICQPGDVLIISQGNSGHTIIYVGNELVRKKFPNSDGNMFQAAYNGHYAKYPSIDKVTKPGRDFNLYRPTGKGEFKNPFINISDYIDFNHSG